MQKIKYCIIKADNDYFALRTTQVVDILDGFNEKFISLFSKNKNVRLFYKDQQIQMIDSSRIFKNSNDERLKIKKIIVVRDTSKKENDLYGFPIQEITGHAFFEDLLLTAIDILHTKAFCSCSVKHENKTINMLDMRKIFYLESHNNLLGTIYANQPCYDMGREN